jgi:hypothetical protein
MQLNTTGPDSRSIGTIENEIHFIREQLAKSAQDWVAVVAGNPDSFRNIETEAAELFLRLSGPLLAAVLLAATAKPEFLEKCNAAVRHHVTPLAQGRKQTVMIRFLCGLVFHIVTTYFPPARKKKNEVVAEKRSGLSPEQALLGFGVKCSPGLEEKVARAVALYPSIKLAQQELKRQGIAMNVKEIRRIAMQCGEGILSLRFHRLINEFLEGRLACGTELHGKAVVIELDGGRVRTRKNKAGKRTKGRRPKFDAPWREPKVMIIYTVDENGKKEKHSRVWIDGTFQDANHTCDMVIAHLRRLGASGACSVTFISDGAEWIWNRLDVIVREAEIPREIVEYVLDFYHASGHLSKALKELPWSDAEFYEEYKRLRHDLRSGLWTIVVARLKELGVGIGEGWTGYD